MPEKFTTRRELADILLFPRRAARSPDEQLFIEIRVIGQHGQLISKQVSLPNEEVAQIGEEILNGEIEHG